MNTLRCSKRWLSLWSMAAVLIALVTSLWVERQHQQRIDAVGSPQSKDVDHKEAPRFEPRALNSRRFSADLISDRVEKVISLPSIGEAAAAKAFGQLLKGDLRDVANLDRDFVRTMAAELTRGLSKTEIAEFMGRTLGIPREAVLARENPAELAVEFVDSLAGHSTSDPLPSVLVVTEACAPDGRLIGKAHVIPIGHKRVYAVFENKRSLAGRTDVLTVWRNLDEEQLVFTQSEPIHSDSYYNFVWLELENGWPAGRYRVDLYDPAHPTRKLASERFCVR